MLSIPRTAPAVARKAGNAHRLVTDRCDTSRPLNVNAPWTAGLRKRLLIVEDYQQLRELMQDVLGEMCDHAIETAADGESAARLAANQAFDLVLLDIGLTGKLSGWDIAHVVRARAPCPILFISGHEPDPAARTTQVLPSDDWLKKPFRIDVLVATVMKLLNAGDSYLSVAS